MVGLRLGGVMQGRDGSARSDGGTPRVTGVASRSDPVDARADRVVQGAIAVVTLGAFVFRAIWVIPVLAVLVGLGAAAGPAGNVLHRLFAEVAGPRLSPTLATVPAATVRAQDGLAVALFGFATLCLLVSLSAIAWIVALAAAGVAAVAATTRVHLGVTLRDRFTRR
jgi:Domain of unknown function (DUF4395)